MLDNEYSKYITRIWKIIFFPLRQYLQERLSVLCENYINFFFILITCLLQSVRRHLVTVVSIVLEACRRYFQ